MSRDGSFPSLYYTSRSVYKDDCDDMSVIMGEVIKQLRLAYCGGGTQHIVDCVFTIGIIS